MKCSLSGQAIKRLWLCSGIVCGFLLGFTFFAYAVYSHSYEKNPITYQAMGLPFKGHLSGTVK